jgi:glycerol kinase
MNSDYGRLIGSRIPVRSVCGDQNAAMFGFGAPGPDVALVNIGSGAFVLREIDQFSRSASQLTGIAYADEQAASYMREATINGAGNALSWAEQHWNMDHLSDRLPEWLMRVEQPPVFINAVGGLGTPWMRGGMPSFFVDDADYSDAEKAVAIIESIVFMIQVNLELMAAEAPLKRIRVSGGLSNLDGLCQKLGNLSGLDIERTVITEATARGVAWLAAGRPQSWGEGDNDNGVETVSFKPQHDQALHARYQQFRSGIERLLVSGGTVGARQ